jgi:hypothetical protein
MSPSHAVKQQRRYRYYVSSMAAAAEDASAKTAALRLPAPELEQAVLDAITGLLTDQRTVIALPQADARLLVHRSNAAQALATKLAKGGKAELRIQLQSLGLAMVVHQDRIEASISQRLLVALLDGAAPAVEDDGVRMSLAIPTKPDRRGHNLKLVLRSEKERPARIDPNLIALLQKAEATRQQLFAVADPDQRPDRAAERMARLAFLAPDIVAAILEGRQPPSLTSRRLLKYTSVPLDWKSQRLALGF